MKRTFASTLAVLVLTATVQTQEGGDGQAGQGQASDASASSSTIVSAPVQSSASTPSSVWTTEASSRGSSDAAEPFDFGPVGLEEQMPFDPLGSFGAHGQGIGSTDLATNPLAPTESLLIAADQAVSHAAHDAASIATPVPGPAPLLAMAIGLAGLALKRKR